MSIITEFNIDQFWEAEDVYSKMLDRIKERAREIAIEFGKTTKNWTTTNIELVCIDEEMDVLVNATLVKNRSEVDKARGVAEEKTTFQFPMDWLFYDDYKEDMKEDEKKRKLEEDGEYAEYLRLKEKFEQR